jgi:hypothetical protein
MKINKTTSALAVAVAFGLATGSQAANTVFITGSTSFRAQVFSALTDLGLSVQGGATSGNNVFTFTGTVANNLPAPSNSVPLLTKNDTGVTVFCSFTGSAEAINTLANKVSPFYTNYTGTPAGFQYVNGGDLGFCDVAQSSTPYSVAPLPEIVSGDGAASSYGAGIVVIPFTWATSADAGTKILNVTPYIINDAYANGTEPLSFFTGNKADAGTTVFATGRTNDSGTRITGLLDVGYNTQDTVSQYALGSAGVCPGVGLNTGTVAGTWQSVVDDGYTSGGNVVKALDVTGTGDAIGYLGWPDANNLKNGALPITYQGENPTTVSPITSSSWTGGTTAWNLAAVANGQYTYWSYEHLYQSSDVANGSFAQQFGHDLVNGLEYEIVNPKVGTIQTALLISQMNVNRAGGDGTDVLQGN